MFFTTAFIFAVLPFLAEAVPNKRASSQNIHIPGNLSKCLGVKVGPYNGAPIESVQCGQAGYLTAWDISFGNNVNGIPLSGTGFCMDATTGTANNTPLKVWQCYNPVPVQQGWYFTNDLHIAVTGTNQCVDLGPSGPQTYQCIGGNSNQIWTINDSGLNQASSTTVASTTSAKSTSTTSAQSTSATSAKSTSTTSSTSSAPVASSTVKFTGQQIHFQGSSTGCLTTGHYVPAPGSPVYINGCGSTTDVNYAPTQLWNITRNVAGQVKLANKPDLCLDAGVSPNNNNSPVTVYTCLYQSNGSPVPQQNWYYTPDNHLALVGLTQCLDVIRDSKPTQTKPDGSLQDVSTWQCSGNDIQQIFTI